jgi:hypothetical protein
MQITTGSNAAAMRIAFKKKVMLRLSPSRTVDVCAECASQPELLGSVPYI